MSIRSAKLFLPNGKASPFLIQQLFRRAPRQALQAGAVLVDGGVATRYLASWWRAAFPTRRPLTSERIANDDGTGTTLFWDALA